MTGPSKNYTSIDTGASFVKNDPVYNVKAWGANGDGSDDTTAIQNAIDAATTNGGVVLFPPGTYAITSRLENLSDVTLQGSGEDNTTLTQPNGTNLSLMVYANGDSNVVVRDMTIDGNQTNNTTSVVGVRFGSVGSNYVVERCSFFDMASSAIEFDTFGNGRATDMEVRDCYFEDIGITDTRAAIYNLGQTDRFTVESCRFDTVHVGVWIADIRGIWTDTNYINNRVYFPRNRSLYMDGGVHGRFIGNYAESLDAATSNNGSADQLVAYQSNNIEFVGNEVNRAGDNGFVAEQCNNVIMTNNTAFECDTRGFVLADCDDSIISNCTAFNNALDRDSSGVLNPSGITVKLASNNCMVTGCRCYDTQGTQTQPYGVDVGTNAVDTVVVMNDLRGNGTGGINDNGTGTVTDLVNQNTTENWNVV